MFKFAKCLFISSGTHFYHLLSQLTFRYPYNRSGTSTKSWVTWMRLFGAFLSHGGTPSYHPFIDWDFPWNQPSSDKGYPIYGNPHWPNSGESDFGYPRLAIFIRNRGGQSRQFPFLYVKNDDQRGDFGISYSQANLQMKHYVLTRLNDQLQSPTLW